MVAGHTAALWATAASAAGLLIVLLDNPPITPQTPDRYLQVLIFVGVSLVLTWMIARARHVELALRHTLAEQRQAQTALETSEKRFRALIEYSWDAVALFSADGRVLYASPATTACSAMSWRTSSATARSSSSIPTIIRPSSAASRGRSNSRANVDVHARVKHANGSWRELEGVFTNLLADSSVGAIVNNYRDVTERRQLERQFLQAQKMEAIGVNGQELSQELTMRRPSLKTLFISGYTESAMIQQEMLHDGVAYLPKPFTPQELAATVRRILDQSQ